MNLKALSKGLAPWSVQKKGTEKKSSNSFASTDQKYQNMKLKDKNKGLKIIQFKIRQRQPVLELSKRSVLSISSQPKSCSVLV